MGMNFFADLGEGALQCSQSLDGERFRLSLERIETMCEEECAAPASVPFFRYAAGWVLMLLDHRRMLEDGSFNEMEISGLEEKNRALYEDIFPENYGHSWANPGFAIEQLGSEMGPVISAFMMELRSMISLVYEGDAERFLIRMELLLEIYFAFVTAYSEYKAEAEDREESSGNDQMIGGNRGRNRARADAMPPADHIREKIRQFLEDYARDETLVRVQRNLVGGSVPERIIGEWYLPGDMRCLYRYGAYVSENEKGVFTYLENLDDETIARMADTWTEGFRIGFEVTGKDLSIRKRAGLLYHIGFERVVKRAVENLKKIGLEAVIPGMQGNLFTQHLGRGGGGYSTTPANRQYGYDHREDLALFFNDVLRSRRSHALQQAYKELEKETVLYAGPLVMETFGEKPFSPVMHEGYARFSKAQQKKIARCRQEADLLYDRAVIGRERSFTIIAFPIPEITKGYADGDLKASFDEIFHAVIEINTLDYMTYRDVQAHIIDVLDTAQSIHVLGAGENRTDLRVRLQMPEDPQKQTIFENCVADVNIPVGEVFTTPALEGTEGLLHVTRVYLNGLLFEDLAIRFEKGRIADYSCGGFPTPEEGRKYIEENILFHHETLPMGECAIGTNTTASVLAEKLGFLERLPILIAEKTGPHFAVGDTCYSHEEENRVYNPDGKEIFAKENEYSLMRETDPERAYFGCHTDITIPYEEVGLLAAVRADGRQIPLIRDGKFVLEGTDILNLPFAEKVPSL